LGASNLVIGVLAAIPPLDAVAQHWDFFFSLAFLIGLYSIHRLAKVKRNPISLLTHGQAIGRLGGENWQKDFFNF
jgi:hypothetical protein